MARTARFFLLCAIAGLSVSVRAAGPLYAPGAGGNGGSVGYTDGGSMLRELLDGRTFQPKPAGAVVSDRLSIPGPDGKPFGLSVDRSITTAAIAVAARLLLGPTAPIAIAVGSVLWDELKKQGIERGSDGSPKIDPGRDQEPTVKYRNYDGTFVGGYEAADLYYGSKATANQLAGGWASCTLSPGPRSTGQLYDVGGGKLYPFLLGNARLTCVLPPSSAPSPPQSFNFPYTLVPFATFDCPDVSSTLIIRGTRLCASDSRVPAPAAILDDSVPRAVAGIPYLKIPTLVKDIVGAGQPIATSPPVASGPTVISGPEHITSPSPGSLPGSVPNITRDDWPVTYDGPNVRWGAPDTFIGPAPVGSPNNPNTPAGGGGTVGAPAVPGAPLPPSPTDCEKDPLRIGCSHYGDPDTGSVPKRTKTVTFEPVAMAGGGTCPADYPYTIYGKSYAFAMAPICDAASNILKPFFLLSCAFSAAMIFIGGLKS